MALLANLVILIAINILAFWTNKKFLYVVAAMDDIIFGMIYAISSAVPSQTFFIGLGIIVVGLYCFFDRFVMRTWHK